MFLHLANSMLIGVTVGGGLVSNRSFAACAASSDSKRIIEAPVFSPSTRLLGGAPEVAEPLFERFCEALRELGVPPQTGVFGARMQVSLVNDGPVTIVLDV